MNRYGALAQEHWKTHQAQRYAQLEDPARFFTELGEEISTQVQELRTLLESQEPWADMDYLARTGRLNAIRVQAEEQVFAELIWPAPESDLDETTRTLPEVMVNDDGALMPADRQHPLWSLWEASLATEAGPASEAFDAAYRTWLRENPDLLV